MKTSKANFGSFKLTFVCFLDIDWCQIMNIFNGISGPIIVVYNYKIETTQDFYDTNFDDIITWAINVCILFVFWNTFVLKDMTSGYLIRR